MQSRGHRAFKNMARASCGDPSSLNQADLDELEVAQAHEYMMAKEERKKLKNRDAKPKMNPLPRSPKCFGCLRYLDAEKLKLCGGCNIGTYVNTTNLIFFSGLNTYLWWIQSKRKNNFRFMINREKLI